jgi:quinolinate synthase
MDKALRGKADGAPGASRIAPSARPGYSAGEENPAMSPDEQALYEQMKEKLGRILPDAEIRLKAGVALEILKWKKRRNAVLLAHNYMEPALFYTVPDFRGDSLDLSRKAASVTQEVIVFCGVRFMAETAKILSPGKTVLLPAERAGCSLAESITAEDVRNLRKQFPGVPVVTYVNTYADVKAETDICCTSSNAKAVVESLHAETVIFLPDEYLAKNVARETGKHIIFPSRLPVDGAGLLDVQLIGWHGRCEVHERFTVEDIENARRQFPDVLVLAHPECSPEVTAAADFSGSTNAMIRFVEERSATQYLVLTECAMGDNIAAAHPDKEMIRMCSIRCPHMNEITLQDTLDALRLNRYAIEVPEPIRLRALRSVERMLAIG